jgi:DNA recombination protein Rad52
MNDRETIAKLLVQPLDIGDIADRQQSGQTLSYIESHIALRHANTIFGWDGWSDTIVSMNLVDGPREVSKDGKTNIYTGYTCVVRVTVGGVTREGIGFGQGIDRDPGKSHESAVKEAESDALKRALRTFGAQFGLDLYDKQYLAGLKRGNAGYNQRNGPKDAPTPSPVPVTASDKMKTEESRKILKSIGKTGPNPEAVQWRSDWKAALDEVGLDMTETVLAFAATGVVLETAEDLENYFTHRIEAMRTEQ